MLRFAEKSNLYNDIMFLHMDAADLSGMADHSFDYATMLFLIHELPREQQSRVLREAFRVADKIIIIDSNVPLPKNSSGHGIRIVEATFGRDHHRHFRSFLANGGIKGVLEYSGLPVTVVHRSVFWRKCRDVVVLSKQ